MAEIMEGYADLHTHTRASDGTGTPSDNVRQAAAAGLSAVAITDHDTVAGLEEAFEAGRAAGITVVPGVEISSSEDGKDIHVLGYYMDIADPLFLSRLEELRNVREGRNERMLERLRELGYAITLEEVLERRGPVEQKDSTVGRPHIAQVLVDKGYAESQQDAFNRLIGENGAAYISPKRISPETAIAWIHEAGGAAVLAHPGLYGNDALVERLAGGRLDGIEADHSDHSPEEAAKYRELARRHGLVATAGSDYHGERGGQVFHGPLGGRRVEAAVLPLLRQRAESRARHRHQY
ncbi:PHP domain-containing protein [Paenibacillus sp. YN15]|uniref:PHP domain-containing protein n=1 Tax=Paenibacillus sp. YN15 TaxID=1742774 RepID=UPI00215C35AE|nr:PHP domain-containing protein [Paenibacillus sp. YN15]